MKNENNDYKLSFDEMISKLDEAAGRILVESIHNSVIREAMELITAVSISLGEWACNIEENE